MGDREAGVERAVMAEEKREEDRALTWKNEKTSMRGGGKGEKEVTQIPCTPFLISPPCKSHPTSLLHKMRKSFKACVLLRQSYPYFGTFCLARQQEASELWKTSDRRKENLCHPSQCPTAEQLRSQSFFLPYLARRLEETATSFPPFT